MAIAGWKVYANSAIFTATGLEVYYLMKFCKANGFLKFGTIDGKGSMQHRAETPLPQERPANPSAPRQPEHVAHSHRSTHRIHAAETAFSSPGPTSQSSPCPLHSHPSRRPEAQLAADEIWELRRPDPGRPKATGDESVSAGRGHDPPRQRGGAAPQDPHHQVLRRSISEDAGAIRTSFAARYLDLFVHFVSLYNTVMKLVFLASSFSIVWYMRKHKIVRRTYDREHDTFRHHFIVLPCLVLALLINERFTFREVMWAFSIYLEAVAILPQLVAYRVLYILNWIYRYFTEPHFVHWISWIAGIVQTMLYADFFYYYIISWKNNVKLELPA
ncbi:hypothetical protein ZWY2020_019231 [Hordeum vulgare]|nr:hypothetical protein ZWY2020_019231 [Hordeum vulgare]